MSQLSNENLKDRGVMLIQVFGVAGAYFAILAILMYPVLRAGGYLI